MTFIDVTFNQENLNTKVEGLELTNPLGLTLSVAPGSVKVWDEGIIYTLTTQQIHAFVPDTKWKTVCFMGIISDGTNTDLWVDSFIKNGNRTRGNIPSNYKLKLTIAWFEIPPNATDFSSTEIIRRIYI